MSISTPFIFRPIATMLLTVGMALVGGVAYFQLPVAPLPQVDYPTISVTASLPGAAPDTMAATVATPLEESINGVEGMLYMG
ncbi:efflux RND transporter permease subunit, partial [Comamonas sp.]|uniref:efflux RND transporter permease subunit n=1 Tax=Comamonas sp. TaxID=34028 RepID=UPI00264915BA